MKKILALFCVILAVYTVYFPLIYFGKNADKKEIQTSHILVPTKEQAENIRQQLLDGKKFEKLAKETLVRSSRSLAASFLPRSMPASPARSSRSKTS